MTICAIPFFADPDDWRKPPQQRAEPMGMLCLDADKLIRAKLVDIDVEDRVASYAQFLGERLRRREVQEFGVEGPADNPAVI